MTGPLAVLGPGGVGGLLAALLARTGEDVVCVAGESTAAALRERGLTVRSSTFGDWTSRVRAVALLDEPVAACLVTVKATALDAALRRVPAAHVGAGPVVPLLNGLDHMALLRERYPAAEVVAGTIRVESTRLAPGVVEHTSPFCTVELSGAAPLAERLRRAGLDVRVGPDEKAVLWGKLAFLAPLALLTTYAAGPAGTVRTSHADELAAVVAEVVAVAEADGVAVDAGAVHRFFAGLPDGMKSSMQRDAESGRPTELDAIGGAVLRRADRYDIDVPVTRRIVDSLRARG